MAIRQNRSFLHRSLWMRAFAFSWIFFLLPIGLISVSAHDVEPTKSEPADGTALPQSPAKVTVWFPEEAVAEKSTLMVFDAQGKEVDQGKGGVDLTDASHQVMVVGLPELPQGVYTVKWEIALEDGDSSAGSFHFGVGNVTVPTTAPEPTEVAAIDPAAVPGGSQGSILWFVGGAVLVIAVMLFFVLRRDGKP